MIYTKHMVRRHVLHLIAINSYLFIALWKKLDHRFPETRFQFHFRFIISSRVRVEVQGKEYATKSDISLVM